MTMESNGNVGFLKPTNSSNEDLSEYTDADESISAPTEFLAEFLSAVMLKDYVTALKYCKLILHYEPDNATAKEFYPLILEKLQQTFEISVNNDDSNDSEEDDVGEENSSSSSSNSDSDSTSEDSSDEDEDEEVGKGDDKQSKGSSDGDATTGSYSSLEDDEAEIDQLAALALKHQIDNVNLGNGNKICGKNVNSLLVTKKLPSNANALITSSSGSQLPFASSDSESPTEPVSQKAAQQKTVQMLRARALAPHK